MAEIMLDAADYTLPAGDSWRVFLRRAYTVFIRRADPGRVYNVPGEPGVVYTLENAAAVKRRGVQCF